MSILLSRVLRRLFLLSLLLVLLAGCEHSLEIEGRGDIVSLSGTHNCSLEQQPCKVLVADAYKETYTAKPRDGWRFDRWEGCNAQSNVCVIDVPAEVVQDYWGYVAPPIVARFTQLSAGGNGEIVWSQEIAAAANGRIWKVNYRSRDVLGRAVIVSGWIAKPYKSRPSGGYPVLAFAHGTTGLADFCAPTRRSSPHSTVPLLEDFLARGMVVAATDYQGLGTSGLHQYLVGPTAARSVLDSVRAAKNFAGAGSDVILFGHSQGGHAVVFANELAGSYAPELRIRGTIGSGTGVADSSGDMLNYLKSSPYKGYLLMVARAQNAAYGSSVMPLSNWLTAEGIQAAQALDSICVDQLVSTYGSLNGGDLFVSGAPLPPKSSSHDPMRDATPGLRVGASPMLMLHGRYDTQIPPGILVPWVEQTCARGQRIYLKWFSTGHRVPYEDPGSVRTVLTSWIEDRFAGRSAPSSCGSVPRP